MKAQRIIFFTIVAFVATIFVSCDDQSDIPYVPTDEIEIQEKELYPDRATNTVTAVLKFKNLSKIDYLDISMTSGGIYKERIDASKLSSSYSYVYSLKSKDPEKFRLAFTAVYKDGNRSNSVYLDVDNRRGFFIRSVQRIARVTGNPMSGESFNNPNNTALKWNVGGTDLGIIWEMDPGKYGIFFGDTFGRDFVPNTSSPGPNGGSWRSNVLAFSDDNDLSDGLTINSMATDARGEAREIVYSAKVTTGRGDHTSIPTAAIRSNGADYVHYFNMMDWSTWTTNYSGMYKSLDNGVTWSKVESVTFSSNSPFGQVGYFKKDGYVYMIGTQTGRSSNASLARFLEEDIEDLSKYEYWNGRTKSWLKGNENFSTPIIKDEVGELSFIYNEKIKKWIIAYFNGPRYNITMRVADEITGPWSQPYELANGRQYAQLYGSFFHPLSVNSETLYFTMSMWLPYNVFLMKVEIADL